MRHTDLNSHNSHGALDVGTLTRDEWLEARAEADQVHVVCHDRYEGGWD